MVAIRVITLTLTSLSKVLSLYPLLLFFPFIGVLFILGVQLVLWSWVSSFVTSLCRCILMAMRCSPPSSIQTWRFYLCILLHHCVHNVPSSFFMLMQYLSMTFTLGSFSCLLYVSSASWSPSTGWLQFHLPRFFCLLSLCSY